MYITIIGILLAVVAVLIFFDKEDKHVELLIYTAVVLLMFFIVAFRPIGIDKDSIMYTEMYSDPDFMVEPTFKWISSISSLVLGDVRGVFIMYALLAIPLKAWSIHKLSEYSLLAVLIWMGHFFIIHAAWLKHEELLDITGVEGMLIQSNDVQWIEFMNEPRD